MQIEKKQYRSTSPEPAATNRDAKVAMEHAAIFPTRLALARWTCGGDIPHVFASGSRPPRSRWYAQAQRGFQSWLEAGGFHQRGAHATGELAACAACPRGADDAGPDDFPSAGLAAK